MIKLRKLKLDDLSYIVKWLFNKENLKYSFGLKNISLFNLFIPFSYIPQLYIYNKNNVLVIEKEKKPIGFLLYYILDNYKASIGIIIGEKKDRNKGFGSKAIQLLLNKLFQETNIEEIILETADFNYIAQKTYINLGFHNYKKEKNKIYFKYTRKDYELNFKVK